MKKRPLAAFTLIELMIVISIISILSSIVLAAVAQAKARARDSVRKSELVQLRNALELYRIDHGHYPDTGPNKDFHGFCSTTIAGSSDWIPGLAPQYIPALPTDPFFDPSILPSRCYVYKSQNGKEYKLIAYGTAEIPPGPQDPFFDPSSSIAGPDMYRVSSFVISSNKIIPPDRTPSNPSDSVCEHWDFWSESNPPSAISDDYPLCW